jgi:ABC-type uncharacterized transport system permease subunit
VDILFAIGVGAYGATTAAYLASLWSADARVGHAARWLLRGTLVFWTIVLASWAFDVGARGGTRLWMGASAWSLCALYLLLLRRYEIRALGSFVSAFATILATLALFMAKPERVVEGGLGDWLLGVHVGLAFVGVTAFAFATAMSLVYLLQARMLKRKSKSKLRRRLPSLQVLDHLALRSITIGFPFYTVALLLGSARAVREGEGGVKIAYALAVFSWVIYGAVLQARLTAGWRGRRAAILTVVGLIGVLVVVTQYALGMVW